MVGHELLVLASLAICGVTDVRNGKIYNKVTYPAILLGFGYNYWAGGTASAVRSVEGFLLAMILLGGLALVGGTGGGDAKLAAAIGSIKGYPFVVHALFFSFLLGGGMAVFFAFKERRLLATAQTVSSILVNVVLQTRVSVESWKSCRSYRIPFGVAICLGTVAAELCQLGT